MKKKIFIKQLSLIEEKLGNLMQQVGPYKPTAEVAGRMPAIASAKTIAQKIENIGGKDPLAKYGKLIPNANDLAKKSTKVSTDPEGWINYLKRKWGDFKKTIEDYFNSMKEYLKETALGKWVLKTYEKISFKLDKIYNKISKNASSLWKDAALWQKITFFVGVIFMLFVCGYVSITDPGAALDKILNAMKASFSKSGEIIVEGSKKLVGGNISALGTIILEIILAPFKVIYNVLEASADSGVLTALTLAIIFIGVSMGILYYRVSGKKPKDVISSKTASAAAKGAATSAAKGV
jgi:hypothetical protein